MQCKICLSKKIQKPHVTGLSPGRTYMKSNRPIKH